MKAHKNCSFLGHHVSVVILNDSCKTGGFGSSDAEILFMVDYGMLFERMVSGAENSIDQRSDRFKLGAAGELDIVENDFTSQEAKDVTYALSVAITKVADKNKDYKELHQL